MKKRDKYIQRALNILGVNYDNSKHEFELNTIQDLDFIISNRNGLLRDLEISIEEAKEAMVQLNDEIKMAENLKHQYKVEEYKELNPKHRVF